MAGDKVMEEETQEQVNRLKQHLKRESVTEECDKKDK